MSEGTYAARMRWRTLLCLARAVTIPADGSKAQSFRTQRSKALRRDARLQRTGDDWRNPAARAGNANAQGSIDRGRLFDGRNEADARGDGRAASQGRKQRPISRWR